jgi:hypothetical protein
MKAKETTITISKKQCAAIARELRYINRAAVEDFAKDTAYKTLRGFTGMIERKNEELKKLDEAAPLTYLRITVKWHRSRAWGWNLIATAFYQRAGGEFGRAVERITTGCGYDKFSAIMRDILDSVARPELYKQRNRKNLPRFAKFFDNNIGCYYADDFSERRLIPKQLTKFLGAKSCNTYFVDDTDYFEFIF